MKIENWKTCPLCNAQLEHHDTPDKRVICRNCNFVQYENPIPAAVVLPMNDNGEVLLVQRRSDPQAGYWATVGGFLNVGESAENGARRECEEELGADISGRQLFYVGSYPSVYGDSGRKTLVIAYYTHLPNDTTITLSEENTAYKWFGLNDLPKNLAFTDCERALADLPHALMSVQRS